MVSVSGLVSAAMDKPGTTTWRKNNDFSLHPNKHSTYNTVVSPLLMLPADMIATFSIIRMHVIFLGLNGRMLDICLCGPWFNCYRLIPPSVDIFSKRILYFQRHTLRDFGQPCRHGGNVDRWMARKFLMSLLHIGPELQKTKKFQIYWGTACFHSYCSSPHLYFI